MRILVALLAVSLLAFAESGCTAKAKKAYHLSRADHYYDVGDFTSAEIEYRNVLQYDSANSRAYSRLGLLYYEQGRLQLAAFVLAKAIPMSPDNLELRRKLGFIYSSVGQFSNALVQANYILEKNPKDDEAPILLAEASVLSKDAAAARQRLETMARNGDRASIEVALGNLALREHDVAAAGTAFKKAQALDPKSSAVNVGLATLAWAQGDLKQADAFFKAAADASPARSPRRMQYVRFKVQTGDLTGARAVLAEIRKAAPDYVPAVRALAEIAAVEKKYDECAELLDNVLKLDPNNFDALLFQAQLDSAQGKAQQALGDMERMARLYPEVAAVHYQLGTLYLAANDSVKATASFNRALELNPNFVEAMLMLAQIQMNSGKRDQAIATFERVCKKYPQLVQSKLLLADAYRMQKRDGDALAIYEALNKTYPTNTQVLLLRGATLVQMNDGAAARKTFDRVLELSPGNLTAIEQLVKLDLSEKQVDAASQLLNREIQQAPKQPSLRILAATVQLAQGKRDQAETTLLQALDIDPSNVGASLLLAQSYADAGQNDKALARLDTVLAKNSENIPAYMLQAEVYSALKNNNKAAEAYEKLLKIDPRYGPALNNLAYIYSEPLNNLDRAYELAQRARQLSPSDASTADTLGWICFKRGSYQTALDLETESANGMNKLVAQHLLKQVSPEVQFHLGMASYMLANETTARAALQQAWQSGTNFPGRAECGVCLAILNLNPVTADTAARTMLEKRVAEKNDDPVALARLARIYQRDGNSDKAIATYEAILQALPNNLDAMMNLTRLYSGKDTKKAYDMAKAANKLAPYDSEVSHSLGRLAFLSGDYQLAASVLQQAARSQPNDAPLLFDYAQAAYSIGRVSDAQAALQSALGLNPSDLQAGQARQMLDMIALAAAPAQAAAADARIGQILKAAPDNVPALMAQAAASESTSDTATAEQVCEKALAHYPDFIPAQEQLAWLYAAEPAKLDRAFALASKAHDALPDDPSAAKILGVVLVQRGDYSHAVILLKQSAAKLNSDAIIFYYMGAAQYHLKNNAEAKTSLRQALALNLPGQLTSPAKQMLAELK